MCTLTIFSGKKRCVVTMNRDERRTRKESGLLYSRSSNNARLFYPVDVTSGGTWFGANNKGIILALLNRYQAPQSTHARSRGEIIPAALELGDEPAVANYLANLAIADYNPFDLFLITKKSLMQFSWDSEKYTIGQVEFKHWFMFSSSALFTDEVIAYRKSLFSAWSSEMGDKIIDASEILRGYHLIQFEGMESHSVLMEREHSHTKSVIQADIESRNMTIRYMPEILEYSLDAPLSNAQVETLEIRKT